MKPLAFASCLLIAFLDVASAQNDEDRLERFRQAVEETYLSNIADELRDSFNSSGLAESDVEQTVQQLAKEYVLCVERAVLELASSRDTNLSEYITDDGTILFQDGDSSDAFEQLLGPCILEAKEAAGFVEK